MRSPMSLAASVPPSAAVRQCPSPRALVFVLALLLAVATLFACSPAARAAPPLQFTSFSASALNADGSAATQAGAHPWELTTSFELATIPDARVPYEIPSQSLKDTVVELPPGAVGDPFAVPQCSQQAMNVPGSACSPDTQVGIAELDVSWVLGRQTLTVPIYNMVPPTGEPAQFAFLVIASIAHVDVKLRSDGDYGVTATVHNANSTTTIYGAKIHLWGVPADPSHDADRGGSSGLPRKPLLRNPTSCTGPLTTTIDANSWQQPDQSATDMAQASALTGCASLPFSPSLTLQPDSSRAGSPSGMAIDLNLPQNENPDGLATADLKRAVVTLPSGVALNPSAGDGLAACSDAQFDLHSSAADSCPPVSKLGTMTVTSPLLSSPLQGSIYLASPLEQGPAAAASGRMFRVFLQAQGSGVQVKLAGSVVPDPVTGQLTATFENNPQLPFSNVHLQFVGGPRAALSLPKACGTYTTHSQFTSWASETPVSSDSSFTVDQGCDQAARFEPSLSAGVTNATAGASSPFTMTLSRPDGQQDLNGLSLTLPPGLLASLSGIPLCPEPQAASGTCPPASQIGRVTTAAGAGPAPLWVPLLGKTPTAVFFAGPYKGAPFSLSVVVPAEAGPFNLGTVVVRAALFVDPHDAHVSVTSDPIPTILDGVPLNVQKINVTLDRPGFMVSPTSCNPMQITGAASSSAGASAALSSPFQVGSCAGLKFAPKFSVSTVGRASKANGASLTTKLSYPAGALGSYANIAKVKVELPKQLPSRLTTLQKACTSAQFDANPAGCPAASFIGHATVHTPLLPVPLTGPAIFVSHGGEAFPSLVMVLQGYGVTVELVGSTLIRGGVTSTTFKTVPDVPFNDFVLTLGQGKFSALGANLPAKAKYSFCGQRMVMPTEFVGQNGAAIHQSTPVTPTGCAKAKATKVQKLAAARGGGR